MKIKLSQNGCRSKGAESGFCRAEKQSSRNPFCKHFVDAARIVSAITARKAEMSFAVANKKGRLSSLDRKRLWYTRCLKHEATL